MRPGRRHEQGVPLLGHQLRSAACQRLPVQATVECAGRTNPPGTSPRICAYRGQRQRRYDVEGHGGRVVAAEHGLKATD